ncbi:putative efflux protein [Selenomonas ruminantium subsp. lactilytica TAM6421]|uniref:Putative efflux protein n=1 Tax=Selenomonas ruminantium subsp. lactilytica (strain NBRC 103574 / TAM6421) TaxID=927704 RepID=I0GPE2_SELRL|nr:efflux RND transporter permease subunit [Selenomonas ruminantium]BAL82629.1 putative efflux protein [Selenomonas ruminantium subsp. lactilytica TAM6421]
MNITRLSILRPVGISMIVAFFVVLGLYSYYRIGVELLPALNTPYVTVTVKYPGASAESVEQEIIKPVEDAVSSVSNVKTITSVAGYERGRVMMELNFDADADMAAIEATKKVEAIKNRLPDEADAPVVIKRDINAKPIMELAVMSQHSLGDTYSMTENVFQDVLQQAGGVSEIELHGGRDKEVAVEVDREKLAAYKLTLPKIASAIRNENQLLPSGPVYTEKSKADVRVVAEYKQAADIEKINITNTAGESIPLTAVATVREQDARQQRYGRLNGEAAINVLIYKNSDANVVETAENIQAAVEKLRRDYPDYQFIEVSNDADYVETSLHNTLGTLVEGLITTGLVLFLFLRGWRSTAAAMIAIPTSLISTFFVMYLAGFTFNMMSLMGMTLCVGILVDDSIVVLENIIRYLKQGTEPKKAAEKGRMEIGMAAVAITLCDAAVFMPIAFMEGMTGQFFRQFGLTIVFAGAFSLFVSFTLTPMLASRFFRNGYQVSSHPLWQFMDRLENRAVDLYRKTLYWSLNHKKKLLLTILAVFVGVMSLIPLGAIGTEYMPKTDESSFTINIQCPVSSSSEETNKVALQLEQKLAEIPEVKYYMTQAGGVTSANEGRIKVELVGRRDRSRSIWEITAEVRKFARQIRTADIRVTETQSNVAGISGGGGGRGGGGALQVELRGNNMQELTAAADKVEKILRRDVKGVSDVNSSYTEGMPELQLTVNREKLKAFQVSLADIDTAFSSAISGLSAGELKNDALNGGRDTNIKVRLKNADAYKASDVARVPVWANGRLAYLGDVADIKDGQGPVSIQRVDKQRSIQLGANLRDRPVGDVIRDVNKALQQADLGEGITYRFKGQASRMNETFSELLSALFLALVLIYMLLAVLYESVLTPFIRMFSLPLGLIGSVLLLLLTHNTLNLYSMIGILVMDGIVAKNGTLLIDYTLTLMDRGHTALEAIVEAGCVRLKPIFMTTITMMVGMMPMALALTDGAETRVSMAWVIIGGLLTSTVFTLLVIPIIFLYFYQGREGRRSAVEN